MEIVGDLDPSAISEPASSTQLLNLNEMFTVKLSLQAKNFYCYVVDDKLPHLPTL
jgi:hypothetical protein